MIRIERLYDSLVTSAGATGGRPRLAARAGELALPVAPLVLRGECYPENPLPLFAEVQAAVERCLARPGGRTLEVTLQLGYVNSASTKLLRKLFHRLDRAVEEGQEVTLTWEHEATDETMAELGRDLAEDLHFLDLRTRAYEVRAAG